MRRATDNSFLLSFFSPSARGDIGERFVKNEHGDDVERTDERTNERPDGRMQVRTGRKMEASEEEEEEEKVERKKGRGRVRGETAERRRMSKNISENTAVRMSYRLADSTAAVATPVGRWCERGRTTGRAAEGTEDTLLGGYGRGKDDGRSALRKRITLCGPTKTNRARGSDPLHPPREPPPPPPPLTPLTSSSVA